MREFVYIAMDIAMTHLYIDGARAHIAAASRNGAAREKVCQLAVALGIHTMVVGIPILVEELAASGRPAQPEPDAAAERVRRDYVADLGELPASLEPLLALLPNRSLDPKVVEFVHLAMDASATHLYAPGIREHIRKAPALGAEPQEILEILELTSGLGVHGTHFGVRLVTEALAEAPAGVTTPV